jgi:integrase
MPCRSRWLAWLCRLCRYRHNRHTCGTLLLEAGQNIKIVSEQLGHASSTLTLDVYSHVLPHMQDQAAEGMERLLFGDEKAS